MTRQRYVDFSQGVNARLFTEKKVEWLSKINVDLCEELGISIYSFPMKYHPIIKQTGENIDYSLNRDFIGEHWNRKYIRALQAILNSTKGKIGRGKSFFYKAFGYTEAEFFELLEMPETFILYRYFFESLGDKYHHSTDNWRECYNDCVQNFLSSNKSTTKTQPLH